MRENFDRIRVPLHQKREISELEQMREISGPCKSILPTHVSHAHVSPCPTKAYTSTVYMHERAPVSAVHAHGVAHVFR